MPTTKYLAALVLYILIHTHCTDQFEQSNNTDWASYLGGDDRNHYSDLDQINLENVSDLEVAWTYECPDSGQIQTNPLIIDGILYGVTPKVQAFALDAATGEQLWIFGDTLNHWASTSRGVSYWSDNDDERILYTIGPKLWSLNAKTGKPILDFGDGGNIDLHEGCDPHSPKGENGLFASQLSNLQPGEVYTVIAYAIYEYQGNVETIYSDTLSAQPNQ